jgi:uncharacterized membrane protein YgcG
MGFSPFLIPFIFLLLTIFTISRFCHRYKMSAAATPTLQEDQVAALAEEAAAAVRAAMEDARRRPGGNAAHPNPAYGGFVQTDSAFPPATERSKIVRINRQLNSAAEVLGDAGGETAFSSLENFHSIRDGRTHRSVLVENMSDFAITTASFRPDTWRCISCSSPHPILPRKRNFEQWGGGRAVIILSDQSMPALLPTENSSCPAILRVEGGTLQELCNHFCKILGDFALPPGSIILFSSLSHMHNEGLADYTGECINAVRRFNSMFKGKITTLPIAPTPLCGIPDPDSVRSLFDFTLWLDSTPNYCLSRYNQAIRDCISSSSAEGSGVSHHPSRLHLPISTDDFPKKRFERQGRTDFPGSIPALSDAAEPALIYTLLTELSSKFKLELDSEPALSRGLTISPTVPKAASELPALFIGGSNADRLANAAANVGVIPDTVTEGGWILNTTSVTTVLPQIEAYCLTLPADAPVIIYCLDNSSFSQADADGVITPIAKLADNKFHVVGEIIVAHEITMAAAVANLKRILAVCGGRKVYIITPLLRYINEFCCGEQTHCTHRFIQDSATKLLADLGRLHRFIESRLSSFATCEVIPAGDLLAAKHGASSSEILAAYSCWGAVHGSGAAYTRMALTLVDKVLSGSFKKPLPPPQPAEGKRKRSESGSSSGSHRSSGSSSRHSGGDHPPVFTRGGSRGGGRGSFPAHFSKRDSTSGSGSRYDKYDPRRSSGDRGGYSKSGRGGGNAGRFASGSGGGGGNYGRY